jgi:acetyl esterase/lipase
MQHGIGFKKKAASMDIDPTKIVVGGISAGGGIAAGLVQKLHDEGGIQPAAQLLIYPMLDDRVAANRELDELSHSVWNNHSSNVFGWSSYLGQDPGGEVQPYSVPGRRQDLKGLPPTWIGVGTADLFLDEDREYAKRLEDSGVDVSYVEVAGGIHAFDGAQTQMGIDFVELQREFVNKYIK